jgi:hypothetical protein
MKIARWLKKTARAMLLAMSRQRGPKNNLRKILITVKEGFV